MKTVTKPGYRRVIRPVLAVGILLVLLMVGWLGYVSYLTAREDRGCWETAGIITKSDGDLQHLLDNYSAARGGVGLQATVVFPDGSIRSGTSGYANRAKKCLLTLDHHLYIGSITKLYTATLVLDQVEKGTISLGETLDRWIDLPYAKTITVKMLLNHMSGIPSYTDDLWFLMRYIGLPWKQWRTNELMDVINSEPLKFEPGLRHEYSNSNYLLLGMILEKATGKPYQRLLREVVVNKQSLHETYCLAYPDDLAIANGYDESLFHLGTINLTGFRKSFETGAFSGGGIMSTSKAVANFVHLLFTGQILTDSTLAQMKTFVDAPDEDVPLQKGYGLGIRNLVIGEENLIGHTGTIPGYSGIAMYNEEKHYTIVILSNLSVIDQTHIFKEVQNLVLSKT